MVGEGMEVNLNEMSDLSAGVACCEVEEEESFPLSHQYPL